MSGWADGWDSDRGEEGEGKIPEYLNPPHIHPGIRESNPESAHTNPAYVTLPECRSFFPPPPRHPLPFCFFSSPIEVITAAVTVLRAETVTLGGAQ